MPPAFLLSIHLSNKYLFSAYYAAGIILDAEDTAWIIGLKELTVGA